MAVPRKGYQTVSRDLGVDESQVLEFFGRAHPVKAELGQTYVCDKEMTKELKEVPVEIYLWLMFAEAYQGKLRAPIVEFQGDDNSRLPFLATSQMYEVGQVRIYLPPKLRDFTDAVQHYFKPCSIGTNDIAKLFSVHDEAGVKLKFPTHFFGVKTRFRTFENVQGLSNDAWAEAGFIYSGGFMMCHVCGKGIYKRGFESLVEDEQKSSDPLEITPLAIHQLMKSSCEYVRGVKVTGGIQLRSYTMIDWDDDDSILGPLRETLTKYGNPDDKTVHKGCAYPKRIVPESEIIVAGLGRAKPKNKSGKNQDKEDEMQGNKGSKSKKDKNGQGKSEKLASLLADD